MLERCKVVVPRKAQKTSSRPIIPRDLDGTPNWGKKYIAYYKVDMEFRYDDFSDDKRYDSGTGRTLTANIQMIRWWWHYLRLALECEEKEIGWGRGKNKEYLTVDRLFYKDWDLDEILFTNFDDWFFGKGHTSGKETGIKLGRDEHRSLFLEEDVSQLDSESFDSEVFSDDFVYLKIPKNRFRTQAVREIDGILQEHLLNPKDRRKARFQTSGAKVGLIHLHKRYNILVMLANGKSREEVMDWINDKYDHIPVAKQVDRETVFNPTTGENQPAGETKVISQVQSVSRNKTEGILNLKRVAAGVFP